MSLNNPYTPHKPVDTEEMFVDQDRVLEILTKKLNMGQSCVIIGGEGMGKTSILKRLERECKDALRQPSDKFWFDFVPIYIEPDVFWVDSLRGLLHQIIEAIDRDVRKCLLSYRGEAHDAVLEELEDLKYQRRIDCLGASFDEKKDCNTFWADIRDVIKVMRSVVRRPRLLLLLDDLYCIRDTSISGTFIQLLYALLGKEDNVTKTLGTQISFVLTSTRDLALQFVEPVSGVYLESRANIVPIYLHVFEKEDSLQLIKGPLKKSRGVEISDEIAVKIHHLTGGYPLLLHIVMAEVWYDSGSQLINPSNLEQYRSRLLAECEAVYRWIAACIGESNLFYPVLSQFYYASRPLSLTEIRETVSRSANARYLQELRQTVRSLSALGLVRTIEENVYVLSGDIFREWFEPLEKSLVDQDNYIIQIDRLRQRLRELIERLEPHSIDEQVSILWQELQRRMEEIGTDATQLSDMERRGLRPDNPIHRDNFRSLFRDIQQVAIFVDHCVPSQLRQLAIGIDSANSLG